MYRKVCLASRKGFLSLQAEALERFHDLLTGWSFHPAQIEKIGFGHRRSAFEPLIERSVFGREILLRRDRRPDIFQPAGLPELNLIQ
jgi:hypothetical protein